MLFTYEHCISRKQKYLNNFPKIPSPQAQLSEHYDCVQKQTAAAQCSRFHYLQPMGAENFCFRSLRAIPKPCVPCARGGRGVCQMPTLLHKLYFVTWSIKRRGSKCPKIVSMIYDFHLHSTALICLHFEFGKCSAIFAQSIVSPPAYKKWPLSI